MADERVIFNKEGVFLHSNSDSSSEDSLIGGTLYFVEQIDGLYIDWRPLDDEDDEPSHSEDWAVINAVSYKSDRENGASGSVIMKEREPPPNMPSPQIEKKPRRHKNIIKFDVTDLKSFRRSKPSLGWSYLIFILKDGTTYPALHFHQGGTKILIKELERYLAIKRSAKDSRLYLVREHDPGALHRSFDELQIFGETSADFVSRYDAALAKSAYALRVGGRAHSRSSFSKFIRDPYSTTLGGFSKVTNFLRDTLLQPDIQVRPQDEIADILHEELPVPGVDINHQDEPGYEVITCTELPPRLEVKRGYPLSPGQWSKHMDKEGFVHNLPEVMEIIFKGGVDPSIRIEVWKFLLDTYKWESTYKERTETRKKRVDDYFRMKLQWKSVSEEQEKRFSFMRDRKSLIEKDVNRTDRTHKFFQGENNPNLQVLNDILLTYCMYNFDLGYVQGMSDLLAPILVVMENEVDSFWCFAGFMENVAHNFEMDQQGMKTQLSQLHTLVQFLDPQLCNYLESHDSSNMYFCFRWLLIIFKREFSFPEVMRLWEVMWTNKPCKNYHLLICIAILDTEKNTLIENGFGFTEILKHINDMSGHIELDYTLEKAESIYLQLANCQRLPKQICEIIGLPYQPTDVIDQDVSPNSDMSPQGGAMTLPLRNGSTVDSDHNTGPTTPEDSSIEILPDIDPVNSTNPAW
ncbi:TBC1 domain family member 15-like isoform X2 [Lineus longissimus]|uniref:TBC1 domain family member 15-like isoform X2 n=1 Tax=Lineus longissimus TaxID=88925 RepID=UPI00315CBF01